MRFLLLVVASICGLGFCCDATASPPCDCTIYPFTPDPPCPQVCRTAILQHASSDSLQRLFDLPKPAAEKIVAARASGAKSAQELTHTLKPADATRLENGFKNLSTEKLKDAPELVSLKDGL